MGYAPVGTIGTVRRLALLSGSASIIDINEQSDAAPGRAGAGSVLHFAFAVGNQARQNEVHEALLDAGYQTTPLIDRDYFQAIYFRTSGGILLEVATNERGFDRDEAPTDLGQALKLPAQDDIPRKTDRGARPAAGVDLHDTGGSAVQFHGAAEQFFPDSHIVSPSGDVIENGGRRLFARRAEGVYDMEDLSTRRDTMAAFVTAEKARTVRARRSASYFRMAPTSSRPSPSSRLGSSTRWR